MTDFANFNVGGTLYKVSRSLLESHPDTMLAKSASKQWQEDPESEIFLERNGTTFAFVLNYMRDGKVFLPVTESREALIAELHYYGIEVDEASCCVDDTCAKKLLPCLKATRTHLKDLQALKIKSELEDRCLQAAVGCLSYYLTSFISGTSDRSNAFMFYSSYDADDKENLNKLFKHRATNEEIMEKVNSLLEPVGLSIIGFGPFKYQQKDVYVNVKVIDPTVREADSSSITSSNT